MTKFSLIVAGVNVAAWVIYYIASGGIFLETETIGVQITTLSTFFTVTGASLLVEVFNHDNNDGRFFRALINNTVLTSLLSGAVCFIYCGALPIIERLWGMALISIAIYLYYVCFVIKNKSSLFYRIMGFLIVLLVLLFFMDKQVSQFGIGAGLMIGFLPCLANAIYYKYHRIRRHFK